MKQAAKRSPEPGSSNRISQRSPHDTTRSRISQRSPTPPPPSGGTRFGVGSRGSGTGLRGGRGRSTSPPPPELSSTSPPPPELPSTSPPPPELPSSSAAAGSNGFPTTMSGGTQSEGSERSASPVKPPSTKCRKKNPDNTSFVTELRDHFQEFVHASMDEHKTCFTNTVKKMFAMSKVVADRSAEAKEAGTESVLPLQTKVSQ